MISALRAYIGISTVAILLILAYKISPLIIHQTTNKEELIRQGYQYLGDKNSFDQWKINYSLFKKYLTNNIAEFKEADTEAKGAFLLKWWCHKKVNDNLANSEEFRLIKRHCVVNLKNVLFETPTLKTVDSLSQEERKKHFENNKVKCGELIKEAEKWCDTNLKLAYIPKNHGKLEKAKTCCVTNTQN